MDSRLQRVGGSRLAHLRYSDAPRVAQAIVDAEYRRARVLSGISHGTSYVEFVRDKAYTVVVRGDDWAKIYPFLRYSSNSYEPVIPPANQPAPIPSPQPNRVMQVPPVNPAGGLKSYLDGFDFPTYSKIQQLLSTTAVDTIDGQSLPSMPSNPISDATELNPPARRTDSFNFKESQLYNRMVAVLRQLFPEDYPTRA